MKCAKWFGLAVVVLGLSVAVAGCGMSRWLEIEETKNSQATELQSTLRVVNRPPSVSGANQYLRDGTTVIPEGGMTPYSTVVFKAMVSDPDNDKVKLQIELRQVGEPFTGNPTWESSWVSSGTTVTWTRGGLVNASYKWRYRAVDTRGLAGPWREFGGTAGNTDFRVAVADSFRFPLDGAWNVSQRFDIWNTTYQGYHLAEDVPRNSEVPVYAPANGVVKHDAKRTGYGYVVVIEHELMDGTFVCSVHGHLREKDRKPVGSVVSQGDVIGYLSSLPDENGGAIHLHFGIRTGEYSESLDPDGKWRYRGYGPDRVVSFWYSPSKFINYYNAHKRTPPSIIVASPNGGEVWPILSTQTISWIAYVGVADKVRIDLSRDGGSTWTTIIPNTPNDGSEPWKVTRSGHDSRQDTCRQPSQHSCIGYERQEFHHQMIAKRLHAKEGQEDSPRRMKPQRSF